MYHTWERPFTSLSQWIFYYMSRRYSLTDIYDHLLRQAAAAPPIDTSAMDWIRHCNPARAGIFAARGMCTVLACEQDPDRHVHIIKEIDRALSEEPSDRDEGGCNVVRCSISLASSLTLFVTDSSSEVRRTI